MKKLQEFFTSKKTKISYKHLNIWNYVLAGLHAVQGVLVVVLSKDASLPINTSYLTLDPLTSDEGKPVLVQGTHTLLDINLAWLVAAFFFMSAIAHLVVATIYRVTYEADLKKGINKARWIEYSLSASTMMVAISLLVGVYEVTSLIMIFVLIAVMNLTGLIMEVHNHGTKKPNWLSFWVGTLAGIAPWAVIAIYLRHASLYGSGNTPTFVYWIFVSIFVFFSCFALNMYLQYAKKGKWKDYLYGERVYMVLSLVAKTALAWQVFAGTLRP